MKKRTMPKFKMSKPDYQKLQRAIKLLNEALDIMYTISDREYNVLIDFCVDRPNPLYPATDLLYIQSTFGAYLCKRGKAKK